MSNRSLSSGLLVLILLLVMSALAAPDEAHGVVTNVIDGDTFDVRGFGRVRLADLNCPESDEPGYREAKSFTTKHLLNRMVWLDVDDLKGKGPYDRWICVVYLSDPDTANISVNFNKMLVDSGLAELKDYTDNEFNPADWWSTTSGQNMQSNVSPSVSIQCVDARNECVTIKNNGKTPVNLKNWKLEDEANHSYVFPDFTLEGDLKVKVHTGDGIDTSTDLYMGRGRPIWNNDHDTAYLRDPGGKLVDKYAW